MFSRDESINSGGAYWADRVDVAPLFLVEEFGPPAVGDGIRASGQYTFRSETSIVFTVHDYKVTTLWATDEPSDTRSILAAPRRSGVQHWEPRR